jgi:hypothetical protein
MSNSNVIRSIKQKLNDGYEAEPTWIGAEQRFVGPIRGSNGAINNLEEQYILGTDTYSIARQDTTLKATVTEKHFCKNPDTDTNYYILKTTVYDEPQESGDNYKFENNTLVIPLGSHMIFDDNALKCTEVTSPPQCEFYEVPDTDPKEYRFKVFPQITWKLKEDNLFFIKGSEKTKISVADKNTTIETDSYNRTVTREVITHRNYEVVTE